MKIAIITGASRGIGEAIARQLAATGYIVSLWARTDADLSRVAAEIQAAGGQADTQVVTITDPVSTQAAAERVFQRYGRIDVLVNNAGTGHFKSVQDLSADEWDAMMDTNAKGSFLACKAVIGYMKAACQGHIVHITSDVSRRVFANGAGYCASKYAQDALAAALRKELRPAGIKVSTLYPGLTDSYFGGAEQGADYKKDWLRPEDVAQAVHFVLAAPAHVVVDELMLHPFSQDW